MSRRCQHNHHRPEVFKNWADSWVAKCECGFRFPESTKKRADWRRALIAALAHSQEIS